MGPFIIHHNSMASCTSAGGLADTAAVLTLKNLLHARKHYFTMGYRWIEVITFFQKHLHIRDPVWLELKVALKINKYENQVAHFDCTVTPSV